MKYSTASGYSTPLWPCFLIYSYISEEIGDMEENDIASLQVRLCGEELTFKEVSEEGASSALNQVRGDAQQFQSLKSPNMSTDSGFEGENIKPMFPHVELPSPSGDSIDNWRNEVFQAGTESGDDTGLQSPKSPKKSMEDSDFNESPFDKKSNTSVCDNPSEESDDSDAATESCGVISDHNWSNDLPDCEDDDDRPEVARSSPGGDTISPDSEPSWAGVEQNSQDSSSESRHTDYQPTLEVIYSIPFDDCGSVYSTCPISWECARHNPQAAARVSQCEVQGKYSCGCDSHSADEDTSCQRFGSPYTHSVYYQSEPIEKYRPPPPLPAPRGLVPSQFHGTETLSESSTDLSIALGFSGTCKSLRSQSEPSSQYTTVLKPKALRPPPVNLDRSEYRSSLESLHSGAIALGHYHSRRSAFRERPRCSLSQSSDMHILFTRSLETPSPVTPSDHSARETNEIDAVPGPSGIKRENRQSPFKGNSSERVSLPGAVSCRPDNIPNGCIKMKGSPKPNTKTRPQSMSNKVSSGSESSDVVTSESNTSATIQVKRHSMPWDLFWNGAQQPTSSYNVDREPIHMTLEEVHSSFHTATDTTCSNGAFLAKSDQSSRDGKASPRLSLGSYFHPKKSNLASKNSTPQSKKSDSRKPCQRKSFHSSIRNVLSSLFGLRKSVSTDLKVTTSQTPKVSTDHGTTVALPTTHSSGNYLNCA